MTQRTTSRVAPHLHLRHAIAAHSALLQAGTTTADQGDDVAAAEQPTRSRRARSQRRDTTGRFSG